MVVLRGRCVRAVCLVVLIAGCGGKKDSGAGGESVVTFPAPLQGLTVRASTEDEARMNFDGADGNPKHAVVSLRSNQVTGGDTIGPSDRFREALVVLKNQKACRFFVGPVKDGDTFAKFVAELEAQQPVAGLARFKKFAKKEEQPGGWTVDYLMAMDEQLTDHKFETVKTIDGKMYRCSTYTTADADGQKCIDAVAQVCATLDAKK